LEALLKNDPNYRVTYEELTDQDHLAALRDSIAKMETQIFGNDTAAKPKPKN
jgi:hypothetical protein